MRKAKYILFLLLTLVPNVVLAADLEYVACGGTEGIPAPVPQLTSIAFTLLVIVTPIILIIFSIVALVKAITAGSADDIVKARNKVIKKFISAAIIFFIVGISRFVISRVSTNEEDKNSAMDCINCFLYSQNCASSTSGNDVGTTHVPDIDIPKEDSKPTSPNKATSAIFVGDSRTVGICQYNNTTLNVGKCRDYLTVCQGGKGYNWFESTAISSVTSLLKQNSSTTYNIVILLGVNDINSTTYWADAAVEKYIGLIKKQAQGDWKKHNVIFTSVTPLGAASTGGSWPVSQTNINYFNSQMKSKISSMGLSNVSYCDINSGLDLSGQIASDHIHYTATGYTRVYNQVVNKCL